LEANSNRITSIIHEEVYHCDKFAGTTSFLHHLSRHMALQDPSIGPPWCDNVIVPPDATALSGHERMQFIRQLDEATRLPDLRGTPHPDKPDLDGCRRIILIDEPTSAGRETSVPENELYMDVFRMAASEAGQKHAWLWQVRCPDRPGEFGLWEKELACLCDAPSNLFPIFRLDSIEPPAGIHTLPVLQGRRVVVRLTLEGMIIPDVASFGWSILEDTIIAEPAPLTAAIQHLENMCMRAGTPLFVEPEVTALAMMAKVVREVPSWLRH